MTVENINVENAVQRVNDLIPQEKNLSPALKASLEVLLLLVTILTNRLGLNSKNSSKPPSSDPNRKKGPKEPGARKPGGQHGHIGTTLKPFPEPHLVKEIRVDRGTLPPGKYRSVGYEPRQIVNLDISIFVTEWRAEILEDENGKRFVAPFPGDVTRPVQYGIGVKAHAVYMS
jgi:transposase